MPLFAGELRPLADARYAIIASRWNPRIVDALVDGAQAALRGHGVEEAAVDLVRVPGAWEIPPVAAQLAVGKVAEIQLGHPREGWPGELHPNVVLTVIRSDEEEVPGGPALCAEGQIEHPDDAGIDACRMLDLEGCGEVLARLVDPDHVNKPDGLGRAGRGQALGQALQASV